VTTPSPLNAQNTPTKRFQAAVDHQAEAAKQMGSALRLLEDINPMAAEYVRDTLIRMRNIELDIKRIANSAANTPGCNQEIPGEL